MLAGDDFDLRIDESAPGTVRTNGVQDAFYVLKGRARIELDTRQVIELGPGDLGRVPEGRTAVWTFLSTFRMVYLLAT